MYFCFWTIDTPWRTKEPSRGRQRLIASSRHNERGLVFAGCPDCSGVTADLERLRLVGGSKSSLQLVLVTPHMAGADAPPSPRVVTPWSPSSPPDRGSIRYLWADTRK